MGAAIRSWINNNNACNGLRMDAIVRNKKDKILSESLGYSLLRGCRSLTFHIVTIEETETVIQNQIIEQ